jgi:hypothetical protein
LTVVFQASLRQVNVADHRSNKSDSLIQLPDLEKLEEEIKSQFYELRNGKVWFAEEIKREHRRLKTSLFRYVLPSRFFVVVTAPFIYACIIPFALLDLFVSTRPFAFPSMAYRKCGAGITWRLTGTNCDI